MAAVLEKRRPATPRHAASLILLRGGTHVLMGLRGAKHRFMPHRLVFPGGAVDRADIVAQAATEPRPEVMALLTRGAKPALARAILHAAVRETREETGLSPGQPPPLDGLDHLCRAITPPDQPIRYNARFLVADAAQFTGDLAGSGELEGLRWYGIEEALALDLALVTSEVLQQLQAWLALSERERRMRDAAPVFRKRAWGTE